jgi:hypothetical protein
MVVVSPFESPSLATTRSELTNPQHQWKLGHGGRRRCRIRCTRYGISSGVPYDDIVEGALRVGIIVSLGDVGFYDQSMEWGLTGTQQHD